MKGERICTVLCWGDAYSPLCTGFIGIQSSVVLLSTGICPQPSRIPLWKEIYTGFMDLRSEIPQNVEFEKSQNSKFCRFSPPAFLKLSGCKFLKTKFSVDGPKNKNYFPMFLKTSRISLWKDIYTGFMDLRSEIPKNVELKKSKFEILPIFNSKIRPAHQLPLQFWSFQDANFSKLKFLLMVRKTKIMFRFFYVLSRVEFHFEKRYFWAR